MRIQVWPKRLLAVGNILQVVCLLANAQVLVDVARTCLIENSVVVISAFAHRLPQSADHDHHDGTIESPEPQPPRTDATFSRTRSVFVLPCASVPHSPLYAWRFSSVLSTPIDASRFPMVLVDSSTAKIPLPVAGATPGTEHTQRRARETRGPRNG